MSKKTSAPPCVKKPDATKITGFNKGERVVAYGAVHRGACYQFPLRKERRQRGDKLSDGVEVDIFRFSKIVQDDGFGFSSFFISDTLNKLNIVVRFRTLDRGSSSDTYGTT